MDELNLHNVALEMKKDGINWICWKGERGKDDDNEYNGLVQGGKNQNE